MFKRNKCSDCGKPVKKSWNYCPECGSKVSNGFFFNLPSILPRGLGSKPSNSIKIRITGASNGSPRIEFMSPQIKKTKIPIETKKPERISKFTKKPKSIEEPETNLRNLNGKKVIEIKLPNVKSEDVEINELEESIEIKAFSGDKLYFKVIPVTPNYSINKKFERETLKLEVID